MATICSPSADRLSVSFAPGDLIVIRTVFFNLILIQALQSVLWSFGSLRVTINMDPDQILGKLINIMTPIKYETIGTFLRGNGSERG